jgi:AcrR family transcriptional regulator
VGVKSSSETRGLILQSAEALLRRYGNDKLTVVDIARSLNMSHANVYRFFKTKSDILDAIIDEWLTKIEQFVEEIAHRPISSGARIEAIVLELHRKRKQKLRQDAEVFETYRHLVEIRPDAAARRREKILRVFQRLIEEGIESGEFAGVDSLKAATVLKDATSLFLHPLLIPTTLNEETDARAKDVVRFILAGFSSAKVRRPSTLSKRVRSGIPPSSPLGPATPATPR